MPYTEIHHACEDGDLSKVKSLIENNEQNVNERGYFMWTPLHCASFNGHAEVVQYLLHLGADVTAEDEHGSTALHLAAFSNSAAVIEVLLLGGASINHQNKNGDTALHRALRRVRLEALEVLCSNAMCDIHIKNNEGHTAFDLAKQKNHSEIVSYLNKLDISSRATAPIPQISTPVATSSTHPAAQKQSDNRFTAVEQRLTNVERVTKHHGTAAGTLKMRVGQVENATMAIAKRISELELQHTAAAPTTEPQKDMLSDKGLCEIASRIGDEQLSLGIHLGLQQPEVRQIQHNYRVHRDATVDILITWRDRRGHKSYESRLNQLKEALKEVKRIDIVKWIEEQSG